MATPFKGLINTDIRDSVEDWAPFVAPAAPAGAPNVIYVVLDDVGFSAMSCYGGPIATPNIDKIAGDGVRYTQWHTTALCSPTRSCLLTGRNHTRNSMACITEGASGFPNASGTIPPENGMLPEILGELGWNTYMVGKWHLCPTVEMNLASTRRNWPTGRGFERFYGFLGAETSQWFPELIYDNHPVDQPKTPDEGYHFGEDITDKAIEFIMDAKAVAPDKPFFLYYAPGAAHAPHHAPKEWIDKYKGQFDMGYEAMREATLARQKAMGLVPAETELPPVNPIGTPETRTGPDGKPFPPLDVTRPWDTLSADEKRLFARMAEVYAGFLSHADHQVGRLLDYLEMTGQRENTLIIVVSDNGASGEGGPDGSVNEMLFMNGIPDDINANLAMLDELGGTKTYNHYPNGWAMAFNTPFKMWKRYEFNGGTSDPCIISWPSGMTSKGEIRTQYHHAIDLVPTVLDALGIEAPEKIKGHTQSHFDGVSMRYSFDDAAAPAARHTQFYSMLGSRGIWHDGWKAITTHPTIAGWSHFNEDAWELYHTDVDRSELHDLAAEAARQAPRDGEPVVRRGRRQRRLPARRPLGPGDLHRATAAAVGAARPLRLLPRACRGPRGPGRDGPGAVVRHRCPGGHPGARRPGRAVLAGVALRRPRPVREGQPTPLRQQLRRHVRAEGRRRPWTCRPARTSSCRRRSRRKARTVARRGGRPVALPRRHEGRRRTHQDPAGWLHDRRRRARGRPRCRRPRDRRLSRRAAVQRSPAARSGESPWT